MTRHLALNNILKRTSNRRAPHLNVIENIRDSTHEANEPFPKKFRVSRTLLAEICEILAIPTSFFHIRHTARLRQLVIKFSSRESRGEFDSKNPQLIRLISELARLQFSCCCYYGPSTPGSEEGTM